MPTGTGVASCFFRVLFNSRFYYPVLAVLFSRPGLERDRLHVSQFCLGGCHRSHRFARWSLADKIGRKPLVVAAAVLMVLEMVLLGLAPLHGGLILLLCCLANRILSGMAEGMASGADEALVFDFPGRARTFQ